MRRVVSIADAVQADSRNHLEAATSDLLRRGNSRPRTVKTLTSTLAALFKNDLTNTQLTALLGVPQARGIVKVDGMKVSYSLTSAETD